MTVTSKPKRGSLIAGSSLGLALALGTVTGAAMLAAPAIAAKPDKPAKPAPMKLTKPFQAVAAPLSQAIEAAKIRPDVVAARTKVAGAQTALQQARGNPAREQARAAYNASLAELGATLAGEKGQLEASFAAIGNEDDRYTAGQLAIGLGDLAKDNALQRRGLSAMLESGKVNPADVPKLQFFLGSLSYDARDYAAAETALQAATSGGYHENDADALLAEAYIADNKAAQGLNVLRQAIDQRGASGNPAPVGWYRRGLGASYKAQLLDQAAWFSIGLVKAYPTSENWGGAISVVRTIGKYPAQETLDLMRLMGRTNSYAEDRDYIEYIQAADPRRLPGEVLKVIDAGIASGKLRGSDMFVTEARTIASQRIGPDRASLPGLEREAGAANASFATLSGAADAFLSYREPAKAETFYTAALGRAGAETARVLTRLGIAQVDQGKYAEAQATFGKVDGVRKPMAQLWAIYAQQKAAKPAS